MSALEPGFAGQPYNGQNHAGDPAAKPRPERDLSNAQFAGVNGYGQVVILMPRVRMTRDQALVHAAWLVLLAQGEDEISGIITAIGSAS